MVDWLPADIQAKLTADFPKESLSTLAALLNEYTGPERIRVLRCVVQLAQGDSQRLLQSIEAATADYRDVIYWAEYDSHDRRISDFSQPFTAHQCAASDARNART